MFTGVGTAGLFRAEQARSIVRERVTKARALRAGTKIIMNQRLEFTKRSVFVVSGDAGELCGIAEQPVQRPADGAGAFERTEGFQGEAHGLHSCAGRDGRRRAVANGSPPRSKELLEIPAPRRGQNPLAGRIDDSERLGALSSSPMQ